MTRRLLTAGGIATPLFFVIAFAQVFTREGFDLSRHAISQLATGMPGWIQIANFVVTGALFFCAAVGMKRVLREGRGRTWGPRLIEVFGIGLVAAGVFVTDPAGGFPVGAEETGVSWHGVLHGVAAVVAGLALLAASVVFAVRFFSQGRKGWAVYSLASGIVFTVMPITNPELGSLLFALASMIGWTWISALSGHLTSAITAPARIERTEVAVA